MKTAILPQIHVEPQLRADLEGVLREGESLSDFVETAVRGAVERRQVEMAFQARAEVAWANYQRTGRSRTTEEVLARLQAQFDARRTELQGRHRPASG